MPKLVYQYYVSKLYGDMLRYEGSYVEQKPPRNERLSTPGCESLTTPPAAVFCTRPPNVDRWRSFGVTVSNVRRIERPTVPMWTCRTPINNVYAPSEWVQEVMK